MVFGWPNCPTPVLDSVWHPVRSIWNLLGQGDNQLSFLNHTPGRGLLLYPASLFHWEVLVSTWFCCCPQENELPLCELEYLPSFLRIILSEISFWNEKRFSIAVCCPRVSVGGALLAWVHWLNGQGFWEELLLVSSTWRWWKHTFNSLFSCHFSLWLLKSLGLRFSGCEELEPEPRLWMWIQPLADCVYGQAGLLRGIYRNSVRAQGGEDHLSESGGNLSFLL